uniref:SLPTX21 n=1 Tax=Hemiscolopendra marginata TaxID=943146 RepID=A0A646QI42_9MYRI
MKSSILITCVLLSVVFLISEVIRAEKDTAKGEKKTAGLKVENRHDKRLGNNAEELIKLQLGMMAAENASGPGRRRRSPKDQGQIPQPLLI